MSADTVRMSSKGQIVIPSKLRNKLEIKSGTKLNISEENGRIILQPLNEKYFDKMAGVLKSKIKQ